MKSYVVKSLGISAFSVLALLTTTEIVGAQDLQIQISVPEDGSRVIHRPDVAGMVSDPLAEIWVIVRPRDTSEFWVQPPVTIQDDGSWINKIYIGNPGSDEIGMDFEIRAFANPTTELREGLRLPNWPRGEARSPVVTVVRR